MNLDDNQKFLFHIWTKVKYAKVSTQNNTIQEVVLLWWHVLQLREYHKGRITNP